LKLSRKKILIISPESWGVNFVSKHHYATELSKLYNSVYFLNPPSKKYEILNISNNLTVLNYKTVFRGLRKLPPYISRILIKKEIQRIEKWIGITFDIIWNFDTSRFFNLSLINDKLKIAHIVDWSENINRPLLCKSSDICLCTSNFLKNDIKKYNQNTFNIGHGYNPSTYKLTASEQEVLNDGYTIKVGYVGNLSIKYIDWDILHKLLTENPSVGFYFIGPEGISNIARQSIKDPSYFKIKNLDNAIFLGEQKSEKITAYLSFFNILLLAYKDTQYTKQLANPHKLLEYLGSGKAIVSSWTEEYKDNTELIEMVKINIDFCNKFKEVLTNLNYYNSEKLKVKRTEFALRNAYLNKINSIEGLLGYN